ncbi:MAG TPA: C40 family peptidase [Caldimonas sp.]|jgi:cell wall-associated NlpC family hydrolase|nr:C40 family peptidase [Caldimonas sp.]
MRIFPTAAGRALQGVAAAWILCLASGLAVAGPDDASDPVMRLLADKGLLAAPAPVVEPEASAAPTASLLSRMHDRAADLTVAAMDLIGVRYRRGGTSAETGFDCSGFTRHVFEMSLGLVLPRRADEQAAAPGLVAVRREDLRPGDLVFFNTLKRTFSHVGIYIGDNRFIHAPRTGKNVRTENIGFAYWAKRFTGARRVETTTAVDAANAATPAAAGAE